MSPIGPMANCLTWDNALRLGKALSAHRGINLETGGYFGAAPGGAPAPSAPRVPLPLPAQLSRPGYIDLQPAWEGWATAPPPSSGGSPTSGVTTPVSTTTPTPSVSCGSGSGSANSSAVDVARLLPGDADLHSADAAWAWLLAEAAPPGRRLSDSFPSAWSALDMTCELNTLVQQQPLWGRLWAASRASVTVRRPPPARAAAGRDGTSLHRLAERLLRVVAASGGGLVDPGTALDQCLVVPTPAVAVLVVVLAANGVALGRVTASTDAAAVAAFRASPAGHALLTTIGNLLWLSTFAIPRTEAAEAKAAAVVLAADPAGSGGASGGTPAPVAAGPAGVLDARDAQLRALRLDMAVVDGGAGSTLMHVMLVALGHAARPGAKEEAVHVGAALCEAVARDVDVSDLLGPPGSSLLGRLGGPLWEHAVDSTAGTARETVRALLVRRLSVVAVTTTGAFAALALLSTLV